MFYSVLYVNRLTKNIIIWGCSMEKNVPRAILFHPPLPHTPHSSVLPGSRNKQGMVGILVLYSVNGVCCCQEGVGGTCTPLFCCWRRCPEAKQNADFGHKKLGQFSSSPAVNSTVTLQNWFSEHLVLIACVGCFLQPESAGKARQAGLRASHPSGVPPFRQLLGPRLC